MILFKNILKKMKIKMKKIFNQKIMKKINSNQIQKKILIKIMKKQNIMKWSKKKFYKIKKRCYLKYKNIKSFLIPL